MTATLKLNRMRRYMGAMKVYHACPVCGYGMWKPLPQDPGYCPECDGSNRPMQEAIDMSPTVVDTESLLEKFGLL